MCEQEQEQREWMEALRKIISHPMTPEDYSRRILFIIAWYYVANVFLSSHANVLS